MPAAGVDLTPHQDLLSSDEIFKLAKVFVEQGVTKIRLTGGEPLVRRDCVELVAKLNQLRPLGLETIAMTTNGMVLSKQLPQLVQHGLDICNISLDTLQPHKFTLISRRTGHHRVLKGKSQLLMMRLNSLTS